MAHCQVKITGLTVVVLLVAGQIKFLAKSGLTKIFALITPGVYKGLAPLLMVFLLNPLTIILHLKM